MDEPTPAEPLDPAIWEREVDTLRTELVTLQHRMLAEARFPILVLVHGVDGAGRSECVRWLNEWMDPRHIRTVAFREPTDEERTRPPSFRYFRELPPKGKTAVFYGSWYTAPISERASRTLGRKEFDRELARIAREEAMLVAEGVVVLKFWFHLDRTAMRARLEELEADKTTAYRVTKREWREYDDYDQVQAISGEALRATDTPAAPWRIVDGGDRRTAGLIVGRAVRDAMLAGLAAPKKPSTKPTRAPAVVDPGPVDLTPIRGLDLGRTMDPDEYDEEMDRWRRRLTLATRRKRFRRLSPVLVFEGMDAAGKGGAIRRVSRALDPREFEIVPIAAPSDEERAQPYLWRFWRHAPRDGQFAIFDRSWYGRVLVERVEGYASEVEWRRAYDEINDFEAELTTHGAVVVKFWLQISLDEQLRRFEERQETEWKNFKIGPDDWRNRDRWPAYEVAAAEMVARTSTDHAPWHLIAADDKYYARATVLKRIVRAIEDALDD